MNLLEKLWDTGAHIVPLLIVLLIVVFVHEMGHFLIARYNGVHVTTFSVGYGSELCGWTDKKGTRWRLSSLPLGGYIMMLGDADATSVKADANVSQNDASRTLHAKTPLQQIMVAFGGPLFNLLFTIFVIIGVGMWQGLPEMVPLVNKISEHSVASKCGLQPDDLITGIGNDAIATASDLHKLLKQYKGTDTTIRFKRAGKEQSAPIALYEQKDGKVVPVTMLGVMLNGDVTYKPTTMWNAVNAAVKYCYLSAKGIIHGVENKICGNKDGLQLGSVFSIGAGANKSLANGCTSFLTYMAMLSFSLAFFNLLPIPVLDGGKILLCSIEWIIRRPLSSAVINVVYTIGFGLVGTLMLLALWNDIERFNFVNKTIQFFSTLLRR
ncbi:MAG: M50 family metallopeptidase [Holosporales bacterium]|jgi:regulator of sigma E protease|nr:M50 family metallopeptidase [Holosporales bacterium]